MVGSFDPAFVTVARSHVGLVRGKNEDRYSARPDLGLWAVADGMGGSDDGAFAAGMITEALDGLEPPPPGGSLLPVLRAALSATNARLVAAAQGQGGRRMFGSTVVALLVHERHYMCLWAGDSRAYLLRRGRLHPLTRDHSLVQEMVDSGRLSADAANSHHRRNVITRAMGMDDSLVFESRHGRLAPGDRFLLCSDGLSGVMTDAEIEAVLRADSVHGAADWLLETVLQRGAPDNVTLVLIGVQA